MEIISQSLLFAGDNADHNIITKDGKGTFHGMGMISATTPESKLVTTKNGRLETCRNDENRHYRLSLFKACQLLLRISVGPIHI